jgi:hypothetical protein
VAQERRNLGERDMPHPCRTRRETIHAPQLPLTLTLSYAIIRDQLTFHPFWVGGPITLLSISHLPNLIVNLRLHSKGMESPQSTAKINTCGQGHHSRETCSMLEQQQQRQLLVVHPALPIRGNVEAIKIQEMKVAFELV